MTDHPYDVACRKATTAQGLDPIVAALKAAGVPHEVEQTGGFTMVVVVTVGTEGHICFTREGDDVLSGRYDGEAWRECGESTEDWTFPLADMATVADFVRQSLEVLE